MTSKAYLLTPLLIITCFLFSIDSIRAYQADDGQFVVVLDAGHGGHDPGNLGNGYLEKNIALNIVLRAGSILKQNPDIKVIYTRDDDTFVDLYVRGEIANKANADLFVSVHCDSHTSDAHGAGTFVLGLHANEQNFEIAKKENSVIYLEDNYESRYADYDINSPESVIGLTIMQEEFLDQSIALAKNMQENFSGKLRRKDREVKQAGFIVLHQTFMPSVLIETGFLTNKAEGAYLNSRQGQDQMGTAIADAILRYKQSVQPNSAPLIASTSQTANTGPSTDVVTPQTDQKQIEADAEQKAQEALAEKERLAEEAKKHELAELAQKRKDEAAAKKANEEQLEKERLAEEAKLAEAAEIAKKEKEAEAAKRAQEEKVEKERLAEEVKKRELAELAQKRKDEAAAKKAKEAELEKERLAEEAKVAEAAEIAKKEKEAEIAKKAQEEKIEQERVAEEVKKRELADLAQKRKDEAAVKKAKEEQLEKERLAEEAKKRELAESAKKKKDEEVEKTTTTTTETVVENAASNSAEVVFKVQLLASSKEIPLEPQNFNGLNRLSKEPIKNLFRYMYGNVVSYEDAQTLKSNADQKGYTTSYIVAYKDGQRITVKEARKYLGE